MKVVERNVQEIGKSLLVTLPKPWTQMLKIKKGSKLKLLVSDQGNLSISPEFVQKEEKKEKVIQYDAHFKRRFIREYFDGGGRLIIKFSKKIPELERKEFYAFLKRFMNSQIIEESEARIVIKCFRIDDLTMRECLQRMFFLTLNIIDEMMGENDRLKVTEMRNTATRFYYMLVMQVRRYLSEGKFTSSGQVPIIRAMDMRMVAEKIQRICEFLESIDGVENKKQLELASLIRDFYARAYSCFINEDFEKALPLYNEAKLLIKKYEPGDSSDIKSMDAAICLRTVRLLRILRYSIEISKLVR